MITFPEDLKVWREVVANCFATGLGDGDESLPVYPYGTGQVQSIPCVIVVPGADGRYVDYEDGSFNAADIYFTVWVMVGDGSKPKTVDRADELIGRLGLAHQLIYDHDDTDQVVSAEILAVDEPVQLTVGTKSAYTLTIPVSLTIPT